jgi:hypothetical protein
MMRAWPENGAQPTAAPMMAPEVQPHAFCKRRCYLKLFESRGGALVQGVAPTVPQGGRQETKPLSS